MIEYYYMIAVHNPTGDQYVRQFRIQTRRRQQQYVMSVYKTNSLTVVERNIPYPTREDLRRAWNASMDSYNSPYWCCRILRPDELSALHQHFERKNANVKSTP
jgi:hypothetical protein